MKKKNFIKKILCYCFYVILTITFFTSCNLSDKDYDKRIELVKSTLPNCEIYELDKNNGKIIAVDTINNNVYVIYAYSSNGSISTNNICLLIKK